MSKRHHSELEEPSSFKCDEENCEVIADTEDALMVHQIEAHESWESWEDAEDSDVIWPHPYKEDLAPEKREKMRQVLLRLKLEELRHCYTWMVWSARYGAEYPHLDDQVQKKYPEKHAQLVSDETNWQHGFNSGMLSCVRLLLHGYLFNDDEFLEKERQNLEYMDLGRPSLEQTMLHQMKDANDCFPFLSIAGVYVLPE